MMQVNNEWVYEDLTPESTVEILKLWKAGKEAKVGPQINRLNSIGIMGRTSLETIPHVNHERDFETIKQEYDAKKAADA
jgi:NADH dehydrogenase (ubiquinone) flavoprotein 2